MTDSSTGPTGNPPAPGNRTPLVVGLVGGIASGKSTVAELFAARGFVVLDADAVSREVSARPDILERIRAEFGPDALCEDGSLDRAALARMVFDDPARRKSLEAILHPAIRERLFGQLDENRRAGRPTLLDIPLLLESGWDQHCDHIVFLDVPDEVRERRARDRGWSQDELQRRENHQWPLAEKRARSDTVLPNSGDLAETSAALDAALARWRSGDR